MSSIFLWLGIDTNKLSSCIEFSMMSEYIKYGNFSNIIHIDDNNIYNYDLKDLICNQKYKLVVLATINLLKNLNDFMKKISGLKYIPKLKECYFIHLGDEGFDRPNNNDREKLYSLFKNVIRFGNKDLNKHKNSVLVIPMGYISGMENDCDILISSKRQYKWCWLGTVKLDREMMLSTMSSVSPHMIIKTRHWGKSMTNIGEKSKKILRNSIFVPCSCGNAHVEGARYAEALESGAIPLIKKYENGEVSKLRFGFGNYYEILFQEKHPLPVFDTWDEMKTFIESVDYNQINMLQHECIEWWRKIKIKFGKKLHKVIFD